MARFFSTNHNSLLRIATNEIASFCIDHRSRQMAFFRAKAGQRPHCRQTSEHAREITRGSHRSIGKTLHVAVTTAASSCELEAKYSFYFNEVHRR